ncbi:MAG: efflux RND transporter permease subunit, partial [Bacillota bacterium]
MLSKLSVKKPFTVIVGIVIVIILGVVSYINMGVDLLPSMNLPYIAVVTISPGSAPEEIENQITQPVEDSISTVANISEMTSTSYEHFSLVLLEFNYDADVDRAYTDVNAALDLVELPDDDELIQDPIVLRINPTMLPIMSISMSQEGHSIKESNTYLNNIIEQINSLEGVATVNSSGLITNMAYINVNDEKIASSLFDFVEGLLGFELQIPVIIKEQIRANLADNVDLDEVTTEDIIAEIADTLRAAEQWDDSIEDTVLKTVIDMLIVNLEDPNSFIYKEMEDSVDEIVANKFILNDDTQSKKVFYDFVDQITENIIIQAVNEEIGDLTSMISPDILGQLLYAQDFEMPSGSIQDGAVSYIVKIGTTVDTREQLIDLPVISFDLSAEIASRMEQLQTILTILSVTSEGEITFTHSQLEEITQAIYEAYSGTQEITSPLAEAFLELMEEVDPDVSQSLEELFAERSQEDIENYIRSFLSIMSLFSPEGVTMPQGVIGPNDEYTINFVAIQESILALEERAVIPLTLGSLADITFLDDSIDQITTLHTRIDGELRGSDAVNISIDKEPDKSTAEVTRRVEEYLEEYQSEDSSFQYTILMNDGDSIDFMLNNVIKNLIYGGALAILILLLFLRNIKATFVVGSSIVISVVATFVMMYFAGITLNIVSMGGLALGVGMLVDNSIVIIENIFRMRA